MLHPVILAPEALGILGGHVNFPNFLGVSWIFPRRAYQEGLLGGFTWRTEDLQHDISETRFPSVPLGVATVPGTR